MSGKEKIEKDYKNFSAEIERLAEEEKRRTRQRIGAIKAEAEKTGEAVERSLGETDSRTGKKKVNT